MMNVQRAVLDKPHRRRRLERDHMKKKTTYALLMRSEEKGRDFLETAIYSICILSAVFTMWQFAQQRVTLMGEQRTYSEVSQRQFQAATVRKS
jgi:hypothetical protein